MDLFHQIFSKLTKDSTDESFSLFGGTSMAAPLVSGSAAIFDGRMKKQSKDYDPFMIKNISNVYCYRYEK